MHQIFTATGNGYEGDTTFDGYTIVTHPLPKREDRVFGRDENGSGGVCYGSHDIKLAIRADDRSEPRHGPKLYILMENGAGRFVYSIRTMYDDGAFAAHLMTISDERLLYATLYTLFYTAQETANFARDITAREYCEAFAEGRLKKSRPKGGRRRIFIEPRTLSDTKPLPGLH